MKPRHHHHHLDPNDAWDHLSRRYLKVCRWARKRYAIRGRLDTIRGTEPTRYTRIERMAARELLGCA